MVCMSNLFIKPLLTCRVSLPNFSANVIFLCQTFILYTLWQTSGYMQTGCLEASLASNVFYKQVNICTIKQFNLNNYDNSLTPFTFRVNVR